MTVTLAVALALPPAPVQVTVTLNVPVLDRVNVFVPEVAVEPIEGEPLQLVALVEDQVSVALPPTVMELLLNEALTVGDGVGALTVTLAVSLALPPVPVQVTATLNVPALEGVNDFVPEVAVEPIEGEPLHAVALVEDQDSVALAPRVMELLLNEALTVGDGDGALTVTLAVSLALPPVPVQVTVTLKVPALDGVNDFDPEVAVEPMAGEPLQPVALVDDQDSVALAPRVMELLLNDALTVGFGVGALTVTLAVSLALPPVPVQVTVTLKVPALDGVNDFDPEVAVEPMAGEPLQLVALVDDQDSVALPPWVMELLLKDALTVGVGALTVTLAVELALPPVPVQVTVTLKVPALDGVNFFAPEVAVEPMAGEPLQLVALVDDQVSVALPPWVMELLLNDVLTVGDGRLTVTVSAE